MSDRWPIIRMLEHQVSVLSGVTVDPIEVILNMNGEIAGTSVGNFSENERAKWEEDLKKP